VDRLGCHGHCPHGLFMALMADVEHGVALSSSDFQLVVTFVTSGHTASITVPPDCRAASITSGGEPCALNITGARAAPA